MHHRAVATFPRRVILLAFQWMAVKNPFAVVEQVWMPGQHPACRWDMHSLGFQKVCSVMHLDLMHPFF